MYRQKNDLDKEWAKLYCLLRSGRAPEGLRVDRNLFLAGTRMRSLPALMNVRGDLDLRWCQRLKKIGRGLIVKRKLFIGGRFPQQRETSQQLVQSPEFSIDDVDNAFSEFDDIPDSWHALSTSPWCPITHLPEGLKAESLIISHCHNLESIPSSILVEKSLIIKNCPNLVRLPKKLILKGDLEISGCKKLTEWPEHLETRDLNIRSCPIASIPSDWQIQRDLRLEDCVRLKELPNKLHVKGSILIKCSPIEHLPELQSSNYLRLLRLNKLTSISSSIESKTSAWIRDCPKLESITGPITTKGAFGIINCKSLIEFSSKLQVQQLRIWNCDRLPTLPENMKIGSSDDSPNLVGLDITGCRSIETIPLSTKIHQAVAIDNSGITKLPKGTVVSYRGAVLDQEQYFHPETITPQTVFTQLNSENRRLLLEMAGVERIIGKVKHKIIDKDEDSGGERMLIDITTNRDTQRFLVCHCPSTGRKYLLQTPRTKQMKSCHNAAAWLAGFDDPKDYQPIIET